MQIKDLQLAIKNAGITGACYDLGYRLSRKLVNLIALQGMILTEASLDRSFLKAPEGLTCGFLDEAALRRYAQMPGHELDDAFLTSALAKGDRCWAIRDGERLAMYGWYARKPTPVFANLALRFDPAWVYMYKGYTHPDYRGKRLHAIGMAQALVALTGEGLKGLVSQVERNNFSSLKSVGRMGYVNVSRLRGWRCLGRWRLSADEGCAPYGLELVELPA